MTYILRSPRAGNALASVTGFFAIAAAMVMVGWTSLCGITIPGGTC